MINSDLSKVSFFQNKKIKLLPNIYLNDNYPCCYLVEVEQKYYKIRFPSLFNKQAIVNEYHALNMLSVTLADKIPSIVESNHLSLDYPYIVETYLPGKSLDRFTLTEIKQNKDQIINQLLLFMNSIYAITATGYGQLENPFYNTYSMWIQNKLSTHIMYHNDINFVSNEILNNIIRLFNETAIFESEIPHFLHFDIKPQNLIYDTLSQKLFIIDFEFSRFGDIEHEIFRAKQRALEFPDYISHILEPVLQQFLKCHQIILSEEKIDLFLVYYYLSEITYCIKKNEMVNAQNFLKKLYQKMLEIY